MPPIFYIIIIAVVLGVSKFLRNRKIAIDDENSINEKGEICCPNCRSIHITETRRGYKISTGIIGSLIIYNLCLKCGYRWLQ